MNTLHILIPATGTVTSFFDPTKVKITEPYALSGLVHRGLSMSFYKTESDTETTNPMATKILRYLMNPCLIYKDLVVQGDVVLKVSAVTPITVKQVMDAINVVFEEKAKGIIPKDLKKWIRKRITKFDEDIKDDKLSTDKLTLLRSNREHVKLSLSQYGKELNHQELYADKMLKLRGINIS